MVKTEAKYHAIEINSEMYLVLACERRLQRGEIHSISEGLDIENLNRIIDLVWPLIPSSVEEINIAGEFKFERSKKSIEKALPWDEKDIEVFVRNLAGIPQN